MENSLPPGGTEFDRLLAVLPAIAEAVNKFNDAETGRAAFDSLMSARGTAGKPKPTAPADLRVVLPPADDASEDEEGTDSPRPPAEPAVAPRQRRSRKSAGKSWPIPDINFRPDDKKSLRDFAAERLPEKANQRQRNLIAVYYLEKLIEVGPIGVGHVLAAYHEMGWRLPPNPENSLAMTKFKTHWLETSNLREIRTTIAGQNVVMHDMPAKKATPA
jgi:hypothetical protein